MSGLAEKNGIEELIEKGRWRFERLKSVKPVTYNDERRVLSHIFNKAVEAGRVRSNPFEQLKRMKEQQHRLYMTSDEIEKFFKRQDLSIATARSRSHRAGHKKFKQSCEVLLTTGMRRSELLRLRFEDVDFANNVVRVEKAKGKKGREIPMTARVKEILSELSPGLFSELSCDQVSHKFTACAKEIGLKGMKLHSFRHTFGTFLLAMGYDITVAKDFPGHEDLQSTLIYSKADSQLLRDAIRNLDILCRNGYKMVTETPGGEKKLLEGKATVVNDKATNA